jgi:hypothetical protein
MKKVPTSTPTTIATSDQKRLPPLLTPTTPTANVAIWAFPMNHSGPRCHSCPCRSGSARNRSSEPRLQPGVPLFPPVLESSQKCLPSRGGK